MSDLEIFHQQTETVRNFVKAEKIDLLTDLKTYSIEKPVEIAHIDAAKSLDLWKSIFEKISATVIPNKTIWIYQDFGRCRLPWQIYTLAEMMNIGEIIGGAYYGTVYFKFNSKISNALREKIINDNFSIAERVKNVRSVFNLIRNEHMSLFSSEKYNIDDVENTVVAYCYYWNDQKDLAKQVLKDTSMNFLSIRGRKIYSKELDSTLFRKIWKP